MMVIRVIKQITDETTMNLYALCMHLVVHSDLFITMLVVVGNLIMPTTFTTFLGETLFGKKLIKLNLRLP